MSSEVDENKDDTISNDNNNQMTDTVNYAYADDVFGRSTCMKNVFGLQEEMHHAFKAMIVENMTNTILQESYLSQKIYRTFLTSHRK